MSTDWKLKGAGAANLVFSYCGDDPQLRGHVLRVRKASAHVASEADQILWADVLAGGPGGDAAARELSYVSAVMAPLLGRQYVFPGIPCRLPDELREALGPDGSSSDFPALLQPDHTTFAACEADGFEGVGPALCLEIKPKWGLKPREGITENGSAAAAAGANGAGAKAGGESDALARYPRFMLHMLYKHDKSGVPLSYYNPLDLFSGDPQLMRRAVRRLIESPSNNLRVFRDGKQVYGGVGVGGTDGIDALAAPPPPPLTANGGGGDEHSLVESPRSSARQAALLRLAAEMRGLVVAAGAAAEMEMEMGGSGIGGGREAAEADEVLGAMARLAAAALQQEGVLSRLHDTQALDPVGAEGALQLYEQLMEAIKTGSLPADPASASSSAEWAARFSGLQHYLQSTTAKDCGIMVTLQRAAPKAAAAAAATAAPPVVAEAGNGAVAVAMAAAVGDLLLPAAAAEREHAAHPHSRPWVAVLQDPEVPGATYLYKVSFVDLDIKAVSKVPKHVELERSLVRCAASLPDKLAELATRAGWKA